uniref:PHM7_ext domain-containing protein n=1 Tax=Mesocestoides corti TaxID=53468 RepID=A0A5K3FZZ7_MESCO
MLATPLIIYCISVVSFSGWLLTFLACHWNAEGHRIGCGQVVQYVCTMIRRHTIRPFSTALSSTKLFEIVPHILFFVNSKSSGFIPKETSQSKHHDIRLMRKYKRRIQMILGSDGFHEHLAQIRISNMTASEDGRNLTIFWSIPEEYMETLGKLGVQGIDVILNNAKKSIRQRLARENAYRKVPTLSFVNAPAGAQVRSSQNHNQRLYPIAKTLWKRNRV